MKLPCVSFQIGIPDLLLIFGKNSKMGLIPKKLSNAFHPQTDVLTKHTIKNLKTILRACVIDFKGNWYDHLPLI